METGSYAGEVLDNVNYSHTYSLCMYVFECASVILFRTFS